MPELLAAAEDLAGHLRRLRDRLRPIFPLAEGVTAEWSDEDHLRVQAFLRMFEQLQDLLGRSLFRGTLTLADEAVGALSARNVAQRMEKLGAIESADRWSELVAIRNALIHGYAAAPGQQVGLANRAWAAAEDLLATRASVADYVRREKLI